MVAKVECSNVNLLKQRKKNVEHWSKRCNGNWFDLIAIEKELELEAWCNEFYLDHLPSKKTRKWSWITRHLAKYFTGRVEYWRKEAPEDSSWSSWLDAQSPKVQFKLYWPYLRCLDRTLKFKRDKKPISTLRCLEMMRQDDYEKPNYYLKYYLKSNPFTCLLYKEYKEYVLHLKSHQHVKWMEHDAKTMEFYQSLLSSLLLSIIRITFLEFEYRCITSLIVNLELGHQSMHLFYKENDSHYDVERKMVFFHLDWHLIHSIVSLILDSRSYNPMMQLESICKNQLNHDRKQGENTNILALELDLDHYHLSVWNTDNSVIKWSWIDWHFKNVQWITCLLSQ